MNEDPYPIEYPEPQIFTLHNGEKWERTGYCCQCGKCCFGCPFTRNVNIDCIYLKWLSETRAVCTGRHTGYNKQACRPFPTDPNQLRHYPECTYKFRKIEE